MEDKSHNPIEFVMQSDYLDNENFLFLKTSILNAVNLYLNEEKTNKLAFSVKKNWNEKSSESLNKELEKERKNKYIGITPDTRYTFERLILPIDTKDKILSCLCVFQNKDLIFDEWNIKSIAVPMVALSFEGAPGTGKTMAAHAIANLLNKKIILASYADIESMYHGEGPKNVKAIFDAAHEQDAILFVDDAESLLSKRLNNVSSGSENAINSMRDQFLICLEQYQGLVIFASNKAESYDPALETRLWTIHFDLPNEEQRKEIWKQHLPKEFPVEVSLDELAKIDGICGREIRSAVVEVAASMVYKSNNTKEVVPATFETFKKKIEEIKKRRKAQIDTSVNKEINISDKTKKFLVENGPKLINDNNENNENRP
ncbi:MAG: ATP-binding protein [Lentisphaeria bacterium]|nr:ATP-binding protein [Lentisphaeria bacterium]